MYSATPVAVSHELRLLEKKKKKHISVGLEI